jgi:L-methionine (R)-S-oxide reductase
MHTSTIDPSAPKPLLYKQLNRELEALIDGESNSIANFANAAALLYHALPDLNWAGFYLLQEDVLVVGPFQGRPACVRIPMGRGVCGTSAARGTTIIVPNVQEFVDHIACDSASRSEIVVPLLRSGELLGVLDLDSPSLNRFDEEDRMGLERFVEVLLREGEWRTADGGR